MKYAFIKQHQKAHRIQKMCQTLSVSSSGYYDWLNRPESNRSKKNSRLETKIKCFHQISKGIYGSPRIHKDLIESGEKVSVNRVAKIMKEKSIQSKMAKKFIITTDSKNTKIQGTQYLIRNNSCQVQIKQNQWFSPFSGCGFKIMF